MAYRNTIISLVSMVALGTACSKAPNYQQNNVQKGAADSAAGVADANADIGHANDEPAPVVAGNTETPAPAAPAAPAPTAPAAPAGTAAPAVKTEADLAKEANARGFTAYAVSAPNGQGWNTAATPYLLVPSINAAGAVDTAKPFNVIFCNYAQGGMTLHSGTGNGPMPHGKQFNGTGLGAFANLAAAQANLDTMIKDGKKMADILALGAQCQASLVTALGAAPGATYNHQGGAANAAASYVHFKVMTVDTAGVLK